MVALAFFSETWFVLELTLSGFNQLMLNIAFPAALINISWYYQAIHLTSLQTIDTLRQRQNDWHFADIIFRWNLIKISLKFVPMDPIDTMLSIVKIMAWPWTNHYLNQWWQISMKPYGVTRSQWVNGSCYWFSKLSVHRRHLEKNSTPGPL